MNGKNDTGEKKEFKDKNEPTERKEEDYKNETLKGRFSSGKRRTEKNRKSTEETSRLSWKRSIIFVQQLRKLAKKKTPDFLAVVWGQELMWGVAPYRINEGTGDVQEE